MRVLLGIDPLMEPQGLADWVRCFGFGNAVEEWMSVVPSQTRAVWSLEPLFGAEAAARAEERLATHQEHRLQEAVAAQESAPKTRVRIGHPTTELLNRADETHTELIAIQASNKSALSALLLGSVARGVVEAATQSVLLTRGAAPTTPLRLLVATDHSDYAEKALAQLAGWAPKGIGQLTLLHVLPPAPLADIDKLAQEIANVAYDRPVRTPAEATAKAAQLLGAALSLSPDAVASKTATGAVAAALETALEETGADLLVLGAKGQTHLKRLALGSVSFHAAMASAKSVLILRV